MREILDKQLQRQVFEKHSNKCYICDYPLIPALRVHHIAPVSHGGKDVQTNLVLLCSNCHALVHHYGAKRFQNREVSSQLARVFSDEQIKRLLELSSKIHKAREYLEKNNRILENSYSLEEAVTIVAKKNKTSLESVKQTVLAVIEQIPQEVRSKCSYRLLKSGKYLSINIMNYLLFRIPAYSDFGAPSDPDSCYLIFPENHPCSVLENTAEWVIFTFADFPCINLYLKPEGVQSFTNEDWRKFKDACIMAMNARRTREWSSNIII
jgi:hypothetical protein